MSPLIIVVMTFTVILTSIISGVIGMAGGVTLLSFMTFFLTLEVIIPLHGMVQLFSNSSRTYFLKDKVVKNIFKWFLFGVPTGVFVATYIITLLPSKNIPLALIAILIFYTIFKPKKLPPIIIPTSGFFIVGFLAGILGMLVGATGPFMAPFFLRDDLSKEEIVATKAACQTLVHLFKIPFFIHIGFDYNSYALAIICMTIAAIVGTKLGVILLGKVNDKIFRYLYKTALLIAGGRILYKLIFL